MYCNCSRTTLMTLCCLYIYGACVSVIYLDNPKLLVILKTEFYKMYSNLSKVNHFRSLKLA